MWPSGAGQRVPEERREGGGWEALALELALGVRVLGPGASPGHAASLLRAAPPAGSGPVCLGHCCPRCVRTRRMPLGTHGHMTGACHHVYKAHVILRST